MDRCTWMNNLNFKLWFMQMAPEPRFSAGGVPTPPPPPPLPVFTGSSKALLPPFCPASYFSCNKFIYTYVGPLPHLSTGFSTSHLILLCSHPCLSSPQYPSWQTQGFPALGSLWHRQSSPISLHWAAVGCYVWSPSCLYQVITETPPTVPFGGVATRASRVSPSYEAMNPSPSFPQMTARNPKAGLLAPRRDTCGTVGAAERHTPGWAASGLHQNSVLLSCAPAYLFTLHLLRVLP